MSNPFVNKRNTRSRRNRREDSSTDIVVEGEVIRIADFDTFYWHIPSPAVGADRWNFIPNGIGSSPSTASELVVGAMNPWNHADASNYPQQGGMFGTVIPPRTPTRSAIGFDLSGVPTGASVVEASLSLTIANSSSWTKGDTPTQQQGNPLIERRTNDLTRRFYMTDYLSPVSLSSDPSGYDGWSDLTKRTYAGNPSANYGDVDYGTQRAYPYDPNPSDLSRTPWHNIVYEKCHKLYEAGWRAFHFHFPFGNLNHSWLLTPLIQSETYTDTANPSRAPARIKGFTHAIKALLDGTLAPGNGRIAMTEHSDVHLYLTAASGYFTYRAKAHQYWQSLGSTNEQRDAAFMQRLDQFVDFVLSMKSDKGILSITLDVSSASATPSSIEVFRTSDDYRSDVVELADWYVAQRLIAAGIPVNAEARPRKFLDRSPHGGPSLGVTYEHQWRNFTSDASWFWYSDPDTAEDVGDQNFFDHVRTNEVEWSHLGAGFGGPLHPASRHPWGHSTLVSHGGTAVDAPWFPNPSGSPVYSPYDAIQQLYNVADTYLNYLSTASPSTEWEAKKRNKARFVTIGMAPGLLLPHPQIQPGRTGLEYAWWNANGIPNPNVQIMPRFDSATFLSNPRAYPASAYWTGTWTGQVSSTHGDVNQDGIVDASDLSSVLANWGTSDASSDLNGDGIVDASDLSTILANWGQQSQSAQASGSVGWFNTNVRGLNPMSRSTFMNAVQDLALNYAPRNTVAGKTPYGDDPYYLNMIDPILREDDSGSGPIQQPQGFERSLAYEVWATTWNPTPSVQPLPMPSADLPGIVPTVNIYAQYNQFRNPNNTAVKPMLNVVLEDLSKIPAGRRVVLPIFWADDAMSRQSLKHTFYAPTTDGTDYIGPAGTARFLSPWQEVNTEDGRSTFTQFLQDLSAAGGMFDYISDDFENYGSFGLGSYFTVGGSNASFEPPPDARRTAAVVADPRFTTFTSRTSGKSFKDEFMEYYRLFFPDSTADYTQILAPFTNVTSATDFKPPWQIGQSPVMWAWQGALYSLQTGDLYLKRIVDPIKSLPQFSNVRIFNYNVYAKAGDDVLSDPDLNTHLSPHIFVPDVNFSPVLYGEVSDSLVNLGYNPSLPAGDARRTRWGGGTKVGGGTNQGKAHIAFIKDTQTMRVAVRGIPAGEDIRISPWISTASALFQSSYKWDPRYWREMFRHCCLSGVEFFNVFMNSFGEYDSRFLAIQQMLDEWKEIGGNSRCRLANPVLVDIVDAATNCLVTGGQVLSGQKAGTYIWRITVPTDIVDGNGTTYLVRNGSRNDIPESIEIGNGTRGAWVFTQSAVPPSYTATATLPSNPTPSDPDPAPQLTPVSVDSASVGFDIRRTEI